eukprot:Pgem_evm2s5071
MVTKNVKNKTYGIKIDNCVVIFDSLNNPFSKILTDLVHKAIDADIKRKQLYLPQIMFTKQVTESRHKDVLDDSNFVHELKNKKYYIQDYC